MKLQFVRTLPELAPDEVLRALGVLEWKGRIGGRSTAYMEGDSAPGLDDSPRLAVLAAGLGAVLKPRDGLFVDVVDDCAATGVAETGWVGTVVAAGRV